jgi:hypothetical protein
MKNEARKWQLQRKIEDRIQETQFRPRPGQRGFRGVGVRWTTLPANETHGRLIMQRFPAPKESIANLDSLLMGITTRSAKSTGKDTGLNGCGR